MQRFMNGVSAAAILAAGALAATSAKAQTVINLNALAGLAPASELENTASGKAALAANLTQTYDIQHGTDEQPLLLSFPAQEEKALQDAFITGGNAYELSDGLGTTLGAAYQSLTSYSSTNDGTTSTYTSLSPALANLITYTYDIAGADSNAGKYFFSNETANGVTPVSAAADAILTNANGVTDVFGKAYNLPGGSHGADPYGDSRPFQTEPSYLTYSGTDFFGVSTTNTAYLTGPTQNLISSPAFPSGHTTYGYTESTLLAILVPQRFQQMITRGAEYGNDRILLGAHYTMDVIAGRTLALYDIAQMLSENPTYLNQNEGGVTISNYQTALSAAQASVTSALSTACGSTIAVCASEDTGEFDNAAANNAFYQSTQTYNLPVVYQTTANEVENVATEAPEAGYLLETRFPYLTLAQADAVLTSTEGPGGGFLDNGSDFGLYSRLDLYTAGGGYGSFASNVAVTMNAALGGFNAADDWTNNISGTGGFTLNGTGTLTFTGADTYSGATAVNGGNLVIDGSLASPVTVNAGGRLSGNGSLSGALLVNAGGTLAPGDDPGTLTTTAPVTLSAGSVSVFDIDGTGTGTGEGNYSRVIVNGAAYKAAGTLEPLLRGITGSATNTYTPAAGTDFEIVQASGGVLGTYATLVQPAGLAAGTELNVDYGPYSITLAVTPDNIASFAAGIAGATPTEDTVAVALQETAPAAGSAAANSLYGPVYVAGKAAMPELLNGLAPQIYGASLFAARAGFLRMDQTVEGELDAERGAPEADASAATLPDGNTIWVSGLGQFLNASSQQSAGYHGSEAGVAAGVDHPLSPDLTFGLAMDYLHQDVTAQDSATSNGDSVEGLAYASLAQGNMFADAQAGILDLEGNARRAEPAYGAASTGKFSGIGGGGGLRVGALLNGDGLAVTPSLALEGMGISHGNISESGGGAALVVSEGAIGSLQSLAGVAFSRVLYLGSSELTPTASIGWSHEFLKTAALTKAEFPVTGQSFTVATQAVGRDAAVLGLGADLAAGPRVKLFASYSGAFAKNSTQNGLTAGLSYAF